MSLAAVRRSSIFVQGLHIEPVTSRDRPSSMSFGSKAAAAVVGKVTRSKPPILANVVGTSAVAVRRTVLLSLSIGRLEVADRAEVEHGVGVEVAPRQRGDVGGAHAAVVQALGRRQGRAVERVGNLGLGVDGAGHVDGEAQHHDEGEQRDGEDHRGGAALVVAHRPELPAGKGEQVSLPETTRHRWAAALQRECRGGGLRKRGEAAPVGQLARSGCKWLTTG